MLADPKAMKHILHSAGYHFPKSVDRAQLNRLTIGNGLATVEGLHSFELFSIATRDRHSSNLIRLFLIL